MNPNIRPLALSQASLPLLSSGLTASLAWCPPPQCTQKLRTEWAGWLMGLLARKCEQEPGQHLYSTLTAWPDTQGVVLG